VSITHVWRRPKWSTCKLASQTSILGAMQSRVHPRTAPGNRELVVLLTLMRRLRQVKQPVFVRLLTSLALCLVGATMRFGSVVEGRGTRLGIGWYGGGGMPG